MEGTPRRKRQRRLFDDESPPSSPSPALPAFTEEELSSMQSRLNNFLSPKGELWTMYEWFYSISDRTFFTHNDFQECLNDLGLAKVTHLARIEWSYVRSAMGKPRRFSQAFLREEREKLVQHRTNIRLIREGKSPLIRRREDWLPFRDVSPQLSIGEKVIVNYQQKLRVGTVKQVASSEYEIQLDSGATVNLPDTEVMPVESDAERRKRYGLVSLTNASVPSKTRPSLDPEHTFSPPNDSQLSAVNDAQSYQSPESTARNRTAFPALFTPSPLRLPPSYTPNDLKTVATLLCLLEQKESLLQFLAEMNQEAEAMASSGQEYPPDFQRRYAELIVTLESLNQELEPALLFMRTRSRQHEQLSAPSDSWSHLAEQSKASAAEIVQQIAQAHFQGEPSSETDATTSEHSNGDSGSVSLPSESLELITNCVALLLQFRSWGELSAAPLTLRLALEAGLRACRPRVLEHRSLYGEIELLVKSLVGYLLP